MTMRCEKAATTWSSFARDETLKVCTDHRPDDRQGGDDVERPIGDAPGIKLPGVPWI